MAFLLPNDDLKWLCIENKWHVKNYDTLLTANQQGCEVSELVALISVLSFNTSCREIEPKLVDCMNEYNNKLFEVV